MNGINIMGDITLTIRNKTNYYYIEGQTRSPWMKTTMLLPSHSGDLETIFNLSNE